MAIDRVKKATFLVPRKETHRLLNGLHSLSAVHIEDAFGALELPEDSPAARETVSADTADSNLKKLDIIMSTFSLFVAQKKSFIEGFAPMPLQITSDELRHVVSEFDFDALYDESAFIYEEYKSLQSQIEQSEAEMESLQEFADLPFTLKHALGLKRSAAAYGVFRGQNWARFASDPECDELLAWEVIEDQKKEVKVVAVFLNENADDARGLLRKHGFSETSLPKLPGTVEDRIHELEEDISERKERQEAFRERVLELTKNQRRVEVAAGYWESEKVKIEAQNSVFSSARISVITGWVRVKDVKKVEALLDSDFPEVSLLQENPAKGDDVPVSLTLGWFSRPAQTLVGMFGLPDYFSFDPTPWLIFSYLLFFSFCFGDVIYGLGLVIFSFVMAYKYRTFGPQRKFFRLFLYGGIGSIIFGALTGAWAGNLYEYFGEGSLFIRLVNVIPHEDPIAKPMLMLGGALALGVINQFYGITLSMYKSFRQGDPVAAVCDAGLWLVFLPGVLLLLAPMIMADVPESFGKVGMVLAGIGGVGLVLTQGRHEEGIVAKGIIGVVSLYGVLGTYGVTAFIGDTLSYSRLLALGLTTSIVAMAFNEIANGFKDLPVVGVVLFAIVALAGHTFNFAVSILSAFVHSARLIFLEFFGRFYEGGAKRFAPLGFDSLRVELIDE